MTGAAAATKTLKGLMQLLVIPVSPWLTFVKLTEKSGLSATTIWFVGDFDVRDASPKKVKLAQLLVRHVFRILCEDGTLRMWVAMVMRTSAR